MQIFLTKWFARWAIKEGLPEQALCAAVAEMEQGLIDAYLGGYVIKKRVALNGRGKSGGVRTILGFKLKDKAFFLYGFAKNQRDNIDDKELQALKMLASELMKYDRKALDSAIQAQELIELKEGKNEQT
ncbi:type II toxin-antitoxin system RelE/ParE family toxin [Undibacterium sp. Tian12W]|uniref:type II toxin-antitoxin system RelE/ParE family toxin n=1 Tax=Undibacterium sp. Tian12W TaxID=3413054 RepID=UPI003BF145FD